MDESYPQNMGKQNTVSKSLMSHITYLMSDIKILIRAFTKTREGNYPESPLSPPIIVATESLPKKTENVLLSGH